MHYLLGSLCSKIGVLFGPEALCNERAPIHKRSNIMNGVPVLPLPRIVTVDSEVMPPHPSKFFDKNRIKLHIVLLYENEAENGKLWPAYNILARGIARGDHGDTHTIIDSTSGNYGVALAVAIRECARLDPMFPVKHVIAVVARSLPQGKRARLEQQGIELIDAMDSIDAMSVAEKTAEERGYWYTKQYWNKDNS